MSQTSSPTVQLEGSTVEHKQGEPGSPGIEESSSSSTGGIKIDSEFRGLIPPLSAEEIELLKKSLQTEGCRDRLSIWKGQGILLDGHNRFEICRVHGIDYEPIEIDLPDRNAAKRWILRNQLGRRNLDESQRGMIGARLADLERGDNQHVSQATTSQAQAAALVGVSRETVNRAARVLDEGAPELVQAVDRGCIDVKNAAAVTRLPKEKQAELVVKGAKAMKATVKEIQRKKKRKKTQKTRQGEAAKIRSALVRVSGLMEIAMGFEFEVKSTKAKAIAIATERLGDPDRVGRILRESLDPKVMERAVSEAVKGGKVTIALAKKDSR